MKLSPAEPSLKKESTKKTKEVDSKKRARAAEKPKTSKKLKAVEVAAEDF